MMFHYQMLSISLGITLGVFLLIQVYRNYIRRVQRNEVFVPKIVLHTLENVVNKGEIQFMIETSKDLFLLLDIQNTAFEQVAVLKNEMVKEGAHTIWFNTAQLPNGEYFYTLKGGGQTITKKFTIAN
jgi:hypothetical protein